MKNLTILVLAILGVFLSLCAQPEKVLEETPQPQTPKETPLSLEKLQGKEALSKWSQGTCGEGIKVVKVELLPTTNRGEVVFEVTMQKIGGAHTVYFALTQLETGFSMGEIFKQATRNSFPWSSEDRTTKFKVEWDATEHSQPKSYEIIKEHEKKYSKFKLYEPKQGWEFGILWIFVSKTPAQQSLYSCCFIPVVVSFGTNDLPVDTVVLEKKNPSGSTIWCRKDVITFSEKCMEVQAWVQRIDDKYWAYVEIKGARSLLIKRGPIERYPVKLLLAPANWTVEDVKKHYPSLGKEYYTETPYVVDWKRIPNQVYKRSYPITTDSDLIITDWAEVLEEDEKMSLWILFHQADYRGQHIRYDYEWDWVKIDIVPKIAERPGVFV